jgi:endonuclease YncB( thermonuclease family)
MTGLLRVTGKIDLSQFWPDGESDADTTKVTVGANGFAFQAHSGAPFKVTHVFDKASVRGKTGTKTAIDKKQRVTVRYQGIDAPELHYQSGPLSKKDKDKLTKAQLDALKKLNKRYRQNFGETSSVRLDELLKTTGLTEVPCIVTTAVDSPNEVFDTYGRLIGDIIVKIKGKDVNLNQWLCEQGFAFPTFYASMSTDEIEALIAAAAKGKKKKDRPEANLQKTIGTLVKSLVYRTKGATFDAAKDKGPVLMPKLFRRLVTFTVHKGASAVTGNFHDFIKNSKPPDQCLLTSEFLSQGATAATMHPLSDFIAANGKISKEPQDLVFRENSSTIVGSDGKPITKF